MFGEKWKSATTTKTSSTDRGARFEREVLAGGGCFDASGVCAPPTSTTSSPGLAELHDAPIGVEKEHPGGEDVVHTPIQ